MLDTRKKAERQRRNVRYMEKGKQGQKGILAKPRNADKVREENEPSQKRIKLPSFEKNDINDEVARLSSEVATLKNLLVNRMKDEEEEQGAETSK